MTVSFELKKYLHRRAALVDAALGRFMTKKSVLPPVVHKAMRYSVFAGGKRLRPILCLAAAEAAGGDPRRVLLTACALEIIHTYSLVHDDLPAMDDDDLRRGRPTNHRVFGEGIAILAGDGLLSFGFELMARNAAVKGVRPDRVVRAIETVARAVGSRGMVGGQAVDLESEGSAVSLNGRSPRVLEFIHRRKTGALITASLSAGAILIGASDARLAALELYGENIGLAFQITDDVLDVVGDKALLGKRGSDAANAKLTFPAVYGLDDSQRRARRAIESAKAALAPFGRRGEPLAALANHILTREK